MTDPTEMLRALQARLAQVEAERDAARGEQAEMGKSLAALRAQLAQLGKDHLELLQDRNQLETRLAQVEGERDEARTAERYAREERNDTITERDALRAQLAEAQDESKERGQLLNEVAVALDTPPDFGVYLRPGERVQKLKDQLAAMERVVEAAQGLMSDFRHNGIVKHYHPTATRLRDALDALSALRETGGKS